MNENVLCFYSFPRSGATLLSKILNNHPNVIVTPEMEDVYKTIGNIDWKGFIEI